MKKSLTALAIGATALVAVPVVAGAQESDDAPTTDTTQPGRDAVQSEGFRAERGRHGHGLGASEGLTEVLGLTDAELRTELQSGRTLADIADEQGVSVEAVVDTLVAEAQERLAAVVEDGKLTQEEADEKLAGLEDRISDMVNSVIEGRGGPRGFRGFASYGEVPELLGLEPSDLLESLRSGSTLAELAEANDVSVDELRAAMVAGLEERLAEAVANEHLTQAEADEIVTSAAEHIDAIIEGELPARPQGFRGHHGQESTDDASAEEVSLSA